jgi:hypothetical protein
VVGAGDEAERDGHGGEQGEGEEGAAADPAAARACREGDCSAGGHGFL